MVGSHRSHAVQPAGGSRPWVAVWPKSRPSSSAVWPVVDNARARGPQMKENTTTHRWACPLTACLAPPAGLPDRQRGCGGQPESTREAAPRWPMAFYQRNRLISGAVLDAGGGWKPAGKAACPRIMPRRQCQRSRVFGAGQQSPRPTQATGHNALLREAGKANPINPGPSIKIMGLQGAAAHDVTC